MPDIQPPANAVILAAGSGKRLQPLTLARPKCLTRVGRLSILENQLQSLAANGCRRVRIVTGHLAGMITEKITDQFAGLAVSYVHNADYDTTNSMFSLALGLDGLTEATWVLEGDVLFEPSLLKSVVASAPIAWLVDSTSRALDGSHVESDASGVARAVTIIRNAQEARRGRRKSIGVLAVTADGADRLRQWLRVAIAAGRQNDYYDLILADHLSEGLVHTIDVAPRRWYEIDTLADLEQAREMFQ